MWVWNNFRCVEGFFFFFFFFGGGGGGQCYGTLDIIERTLL